MKKDARLDLRQTRILEDYFKRSADGATMEEVAKIHGINRKMLSIWKNTDHGNQLQDKFLLNLSATSKPKYFQVFNKTNGGDGGRGSTALEARLSNIHPPFLNHGCYNIVFHKSNFSAENKPLNVTSFYIIRRS